MRAKNMAPCPYERFWPVIFTPLPSASVNLLNLRNRASPKCTSTGPDEVCTVTCAPMGGMEEFSVYFKTVPSITVSRVRSYAETCGLADCWALCRACCAPATAERRSAPAKTTLLVLIRDFMRLWRTTMHENGCRPHSYSKIFVFNAAKSIFVAVIGFISPSHLQESHSKPFRDAGAKRNNHSGAHGKRFSPLDGES